MKKVIILTATILLLTTVMIVANMRDNTAHVTHIEDGDTIEINNDEYVRIAGIDAPETGTCYSRQATDELQSRINDTVKLYQSEDNRGHYGRLIRYVHTDGRDVGAHLVEHGYAQASGFDHPRHDTYKRLESIAKVNNRGIWSECRENIWEWQ